MHLKVSLFAVGLATIGRCSVLLEQTVDLPAGWTQLDEPINPSQPLRLSFALRQPNIEDLASSLSGRFDTALPHLSQKEAKAFGAPDQGDVDAVKTWLESEGMHDVEAHDDWVHVHTAVSEAESLLGMKLRRYAFEDNEPVIRTVEYSIPDHLADAVSFVHPIANFMVPKRELTTRSTASRLTERSETAVCARSTTPNCIRKLYNLPPVSPNASSSIRLGVAGFLEQYANYQDAEQFLKQAAPDIAKSGYNFSVELVNGGQNSQNLSEAGVEAALDIQYVMALAYPAQVTYYSTGGRGVKLDDTGKPLPEEFVDNEPYLELLQYLLEKPDDQIPHVLSFSYADDELSVPRPYADRVCNALGMLTARGTTVLVGSGDGGAAGSRNSSCQTPSGQDVTMAVFPATCPWVTAVGAVSGTGDPPAGADFSGGGFSQYFPRPSWQATAVDGYVQALEGNFSGFYDPRMRATPDISAIGTNFRIIMAFQTAAVDGTSASTPLMAALVALANDARVKAGKQVLGWINEVLYTPAMKDALLDVTKGESKACDFAAALGGWPAKLGWDAITGLGVPKDFQKLLDVLVRQVA